MCNAGFAGILPVLQRISSGIRLLSIFSASAEQVLAWLVVLRFLPEVDCMCWRVLGTAFGAQQVTSSAFLLPIPPSIKLVELSTRCIPSAQALQACGLAERIVKLEIDCKDGATDFQGLCLPKCWQLSVKASTLCSLPKLPKATKINLRCSLLIDLPELDVSSNLKTLNLHADLIMTPQHWAPKLSGLRYVSIACVKCSCQSLLERLAGASLTKLLIHVSDVQQSKVNINNVLAVSHSRSRSNLPMISCSFSPSGLRLFVSA